MIVPNASDADVAHWLAEFLSPRMAAGAVTISVPGGTSPFPVLMELVKRMPNLSRLTVWPGDDRIVPEDHPASNVGRIRAILEPAGARIVPLDQSASPPHFALVWLGLGDDGHIASLFPNTDPQIDDPVPLRLLRPDPLPPEAPFDRLSLTIPALLDSDALLFLFRGTKKLELYKTARRGGHDLPVARLLSAAQQPVTCFIKTA